MIAHGSSFAPARRRSDRVAPFAGNCSLTLWPTSRPDGRPAARGLTLNYQRVVDAAFALLMFCGMVSLIEPSPYDFMTLVALPIWAIGGFTVHRAVVPILFLWIVFQASAFLSLMPYWSEPDPRLYQFQSFYLFVTVIFFTLFFSERTIPRLQTCLKAFTAGAVVSAVIGLLGYLDVAGLSAALTTVESRVSGTFKDPNVFGSYLVLAAVHLLQLLLLGTTRRTLLTLASLGLVLVGVFISYSRGAWGATLGAMAMMGLAAIVTADTRAMRRRIVTAGCLAMVLGVLALVAALSIPSVRTFFLERAVVAQEYDEGVTGRFGNQLRSIPLLLDRPLGFGPLRYRLRFDLDPHNSYIGAFANDGWIGGFAWIAIALTTGFVGFRLMLRRSPVRRLAQVVWPALFALLVQGFQIDIDHWRQVYLCFGAVWGMEACRLKSRATVGEADVPGHHVRTSG